MKHLLFGTSAGLFVGAIAQTIFCLLGVSYEEPLPIFVGSVVIFGLGAIVYKLEQVERTIRRLNND